jgi:hypothetical protein
MTRKKINEDLIDLTHDLAHAAEHPEDAAEDLAHAAEDLAHLAEDAAVTAAEQARHAAEEAGLAEYLALGWSLEELGNMSEGWERIGRSLAEHTQRSLDHGMESMASLIEVRSLSDLLRIQRGIALRGVESYLQMVGEIGEVAADATDRALDGIATRISPWADIVRQDWTE